MQRSEVRMGALAALVSLLLVSCAAKKTTVRLTVRVPEGFIGSIRIDACKTAAAADDILIDRAGHGETSICAASRDLRLAVVRSAPRQGEEGRPVEVPARLVETGDHILAEIVAEVRP
jgi:hypothetical protein